MVAVTQCKALFDVLATSPGDPKRRNLLRLPMSASDASASLW